MVVYLNNAATSYPKPPEVLAAVRANLEQPPVEAGRCAGPADPLEACRHELTQLFDVPDPSQVILAPSATFALNLVIRGLLGAVSSGHCVTTVLEHNSVLRPLQHLRQEGRLRISFVEPQPDGRLDPEELTTLIREDTRLIAVTHVSNVTGCVQPIEEIAERAAAGGIALLVDASQSAGMVPVTYRAWPGRVFVAFAGHKGLFGPTGVGGLIVPDDQLAQTIVGGTGIRSDSVLHPAELPLRHEAGTMNLPGLAGLTAGARFVQTRGMVASGSHREELVLRLRRQLAVLPGIRLSPLAGNDGRAGIVSLSVPGWSPEELGFLLRESFDIVTRSGLHCAPLAHRYVGGSPQGGVRLSVSTFNTAEDVDRVALALETIVGKPCAA